MSKKRIIILILLGLFLAAGAAGFVYLKINEQPPVVGNELEKKNLIRVFEPKAESVIQSPLTIEGEARGYWFFEASFPVRLLDADGNQIAPTAVAQATSDWMTEEFVGYEVKIQFEKPQTKWGLLVLEKDNPSGLQEHADELRIPVRFY